MPSRELYFEGSPTATLLLDTDGAVVALNGPARHLLAARGFVGVAGRPFGDLLDRGSRLVFAVALEELLPEDTLGPMLVGLAGDGPGDREVLLAARSHADADGARTALVATLVDLGPRMRVEHDARIAADRYRSIMETARDAIVILDAAGLVVQVNRAARDLFGAAGNLLLGLDARGLVEDVSKEALVSALAEVEGGGAVAGLALTARRRDGGASFPVEVSLSGFSADGDRGTTVIVRDVTERVALRRDLETKARQLSQKNAELEAFGYQVSHALKAPLRTMGSFAGLLRSRYSDRLDETGARYLRFLVDCCDEQARQVEQLLEMSRLGRSEDAFEDVDTATLVRRILDFHVRSAGEARTFEVEVSASLPVVRAQRLSLHHLFDNLVQNAVKFTAREEVARIRIDYEDAGSEHHFSVADNGIGVDPAHADTIFRLFGRLHTRDQFEGTGAGLNIVLRILERHGGRIALDSEEGAGATFHVWLPKRPREIPEPR